MPRRSDDAILLGLARKGAADASARLFEKYWPVAWRAAHLVALDRGVADDVAQETMERLFRALDRVDAERPLAPWVKRVAVNRALDLRRRDRRLVHVDEPPDAGPLWSDDAAERDVAVARAVAALPHEKRVVVVLHYWLDYTAEQIAELLGLPLGTVSSRLARVRAELRDAMEEEEDAA